MAAGQGFKTFTTGEVLTAGDVNGYLMQGINVFASEAARDAAITAPAEGQFAFTKDNNSLWYYTGSAWAASGATGDIEGVTAGVGISGGGTSGTVTITNSMATAIDAKGDLVPGTGADTFARLAVGANGTVLTADSAEATGLKWATPAAGGGITLISTTSLSGSSITLSSIASTYKNLYVEITGGYCNTTYAGIFVRFNGDSGNNYDLGSQGSQGTSSDLNNDSQQPQWYIGNNTDNTNAWEKFSGYFTIQNYAQTTVPVIMFGYSRVTQYTNKKSQVTNGQYRQSAAVSSISIHTSSGTWSGGTVKLYGVN